MRCCEERSSWAEWRLIVLAVLAVAVLALAACGSDDDDSGGGSGGTSGGEAQKSGSSEESVASTGLEPPESLPSMEELYTGTSQAPPTEGPPPAKDKTVWFIPCSSTVYNCQQDALAGKEAAELLGWKARVVNGQYNTAGAYARVITQAVANNVDGIVLDGFSCTEAQQPLRQAKAAGIEIEVISSSDCDPPVATAKMVWSETTPDNDAWDYQIGVSQAAYIIRKTDGKARILASQGVDAPSNKLAYKGFTDTLDRHCPDCKIVNSFKWVSSDFVDNGPWIRAFRTQMVRYGAQANSVMLGWDVKVELGAPQAVRAAGMKDAIVFGTLGLPPTIEAIRNGTVTAATSAQSIGWIGYASVDQLNRAFNGEKSVPQGLGFTVIDKDHNMPAGERWEPENIDWKAAYMKLWGVSGQ